MPAPNAAHSSYATPTISPSRTHKFLGIVIDQTLQWSAQAAHALSKGTAYAMQIRRISSANKGLPANLLKRLYLAVAVPKILYAVDVWCTPPYSFDKTKKTRGSLSTITKISRVQRQAFLAITGAFRTTATDVLEVYTNTLPIEHRIQNLCHQAAIRIASHPPSHPLHSRTWKAAAHMVKRHRTPLHHLMHAFNVAPNLVKTLNPADNNPHATLPYNSSLPGSKDEAKLAHDQINDPVRVYCDGSSTNEGVGAAAILYHNDHPPRKLRYHLGTPNSHTVYEAEAVGLTRAAQLLRTEPDLSFPATIFVDNQAVIQSGESLTTKSGHHIIRKFHRSINALKNSSPATQWKLTLQWIPGHKGLSGNELADKHAKIAAKGPQKSSPINHLPPYLRAVGLPRSISAAIRAQRDTSKERWEKAWKKSPRHARASNYTAHRPPQTNANIILKIPKPHTTAYIRLRTGHLGLNKHLYSIKKTTSPSCKCGAPQESAEHYLTVCPCYNKARHVLRNSLGRKASHTTYLLTSQEARLPLMNYISTTKHFFIPPHLTLHTGPGKLPNPERSDVHARYSYDTITADAKGILQKA